MSTHPHESNDPGSVTDQDRTEWLRAEHDDPDPRELKRCGSTWRDVDEVPALSDIPEEDWR